MGRADFVYDRIEALRQAETPSALMRELAVAGARFGLSACAFPVRPRPPRREPNFTHVHGWPESWSERYVAQGYAAHDPVVQRLRETRVPFAWCEAAALRRDDALAMRIMDEAASFGLREGFCVPLTPVGTEFNSVTFGGAHLDLPADDRPGLHLVAAFARARLRKMVGAPMAEQRPGPMPTPREIEVLKWCADGKTSRDIGEILKISDQTVERHVANACRKLNALNRTQAVAEALRRRLIL